MKAKENMESENEEHLEPMSPSAQYLKSSVLSLVNIAVLESEIPIDDSMTMPLLREVFLPINPRFSSVIVLKRRVKKWKKVEVKLEDHIHVPTFPSGMSTEYYDECFNEYLSRIAAEPLSQNRPLWEIHIIKYPTKNSAGNLIFKLHHSLGDGYSLMGALLSCLQRVDNPLMPLTFPSRRSSSSPDDTSYGCFKRIPRFFSALTNTAYDFWLSMLKSSLIKDDVSPIRSAEEGVEFRQTVITTTTFSIDQIKQIKTKLNVTINDVITGIIIFGTRLYMQKVNQDSAQANCTALVMLSTRALEGYQSVSEMVKPNSKMPWGNHFAFLQVSLPKLTPQELADPLMFVKKAHKLIKRQRNSAAVYLTGQLLDTIRKLRGPEATSRYIYGTIRNTSLAISNLIGPVEQMALANHPVKGLYFAVAGAPQSLSVMLLSYAGKLRVAMNMEKDFIDPNNFKSCIEDAFETIYKAAQEYSIQRKN